MADQSIRVLVGSLSFKKLMFIIAIGTIFLLFTCLLLMLYCVRLLKSCLELLQCWSYIIFTISVISAITGMLIQSLSLFVITLMVFWKLNSIWVMVSVLNINCEATGSRSVWIAIISHLPLRETRDILKYLSCMNGYQKGEMERCPTWQQLCDCH